MTQYGKKQNAVSTVTDIFDSLIKARFMEARLNIAFRIVLLLFEYLIN